MQSNKVESKSNKEGMVVMGTKKQLLLPFAYCFATFPLFATWYNILVASAEENIQIGKKHGHVRIGTLIVSGGRIALLIALHVKLSPTTAIARDCLKVGNRFVLWFHISQL